MLPPFADVRREPVLTRMQMEVPSSTENPHQVDLWQMRQGRFLLTRWNPPDTGGVADRLWPVLVSGILGAEGVVVFHNSPLDFLLCAFD
jgi:hypothetical protein